MKKRIYFDKYDQYGWPSPDELAPYFLAPKGKEWFFASGNDGAGLDVYGANEGGRLAMGRGQFDVSLSMYGNPDHGVLLIYERHGGGINETYSSKGDMSRIKEWVRTLHDDAMPVGLFIPFPEAWKAVKEFIETEGALPKSIEWVANDDLPENTFPLQHEIVLPGETPKVWK